MIAVEAGLAAEALFCSPLQPSSGPVAVEVEAAVVATIARLGVADLAGAMAQEFGDHPEMACRRMRWCRRTIRSAMAGAR